MRRSRDIGVLKTTSGIVFLLIGVGTAWATGDDAPTLIGFAPGSVARHREAEAHALRIPTPENARRWLRILTAEPHVAGTPADLKTAEFVHDKLREWGWKAEMVAFEVLLNYPQGEGASESGSARPTRSSRPTRPPSPPTRTPPVPRPSAPSMVTALPDKPLARWSMSTTAAPTTSRRWKRWASTSTGRSSWHATGRSSAG